MWNYRSAPAGKWNGSLQSLQRPFGKMQVYASLSANIQAAKPSFESNLASVYSIGRRWFATLELTAKQVRDNYAFYVTPGLYRRFKHRLEVGAGAPFGIGGPSPAVGIVTKMNWEIAGGNRRPSKLRRPNPSHDLRLLKAPNQESPDCGFAPGNLWCNKVAFSDSAAQCPDARFQV
jgi:hypothetical protein